VIIRGIVEIARALDITVLAEGVEPEAEVAALREAGVSIFQGYLFARPEI
jgi:EAL domain-containing protein (putative c-di-GMP-specific phosphodiesterase class I)